MNNRERFKKIINFEAADYIPIFGFPGAAGVSRSYWTTIRKRLVDTGMPAHVGSAMQNGSNVENYESWNRYWGTTGPIECDIGLGRGVKGFDENRRVEGDFEIIESESGAVTRQVIDNDNTYSMPEFIVYPVRDRKSWEFYRERMTPSEVTPLKDYGKLYKRYEMREAPLYINVEGPYHFIRQLMGTEGISLAFYNEPELIHSMVSWNLEQARKCIFPVIERLKPEIVAMNEDICYNHGMLLSPAHFREFAGVQYREVCDLTRACGMDLVAVDTDGNAMEYVSLARSYGVNGFYPFEVKAGNDLFVLRERFPDLVLFGWLEKEVVNEGNEDKIEPEIMSKVPFLIKKGGYFPNADHSLQPLVTFDNLCKFMTVLHDVCGNPEGDFPRRK